MLSSETLELREDESWSTFFEKYKYFIEMIEFVNLTSETVITFDGVLRLEGVFLESLVAAWCISKGENVVPRPSTGDVQHDVLTERYDGFCFYECTGLETVTKEKVRRFNKDVLTLNDELQRRYGKPLKEVWFIAANLEESWTPDAKEEFKEVSSGIQEKIKGQVNFLSGDNLLIELISSGVLGLRYVHDRVYWAGPEDVAIRYDPTKHYFVIDRCNETVLYKYRKTHFSLLPSFYWDRHYRHLFESVAKEKGELPLSVFGYYPEEGLRFKDVNQLMDLYSEYVNSFRRGYVLEKGKDYMLEEYVSRRRNRYYTLNIFTLGERNSPDGCYYVSKDLLDSLLGGAYLFVNRLRKENKIPADERVEIVVVSATQYWSPLAWGLVPELPSAYKEEVSAQSLIAGNELLFNLLSRGVLGLKFKEKNRIACVGPGVPAIRVTITDNRYTIGIGEKPIYV